MQIDLASLFGQAKVWRQRGRQALAGHWQVAAVATLAGLVIILGLNWLIAADGIMSWLAGVLALLAGGPVVYIWHWLALRLVRRQRLDWSQLNLSGRNFWRICRIYWLTAVKVLLWSGLFGAYAVFGLVLMGTTASLINSLGTAAVLVWVVILLVVATTLLVAVALPWSLIVVRYGLTFFVAVDQPELNARAVAARVRQLMRGQTWSYWALSVSFVGWIGLSAAVFGVGLGWSIPYLLAAAAAFYEQALRAEK